MIPVGLNKADFEYDIYALTKAFYPRETPQMFYPEAVAAGVEGGRTAGDVCAAEEEKNMLLLVSYDAQVLCARLWNVAEAAAEVLARMQAGADVFASDVRQKETDAKAGWAVEKTADGVRGVTGCGGLDRIETKNRLKRLLYRMYAAESGRTLPWGSLNGVRPGKIPMGMLAKGAADEEIRDLMREKYLASDEKIALITQVAHREREMLSKMQGEPLDGWSLYIGIPFCPSTCLYCSFTSYPAAAWTGRMDDYLSAVEAEIRWTANAMKGRRLDTIYVGGGTPTTLSPDQLRRLCRMVKEHLDLSALLEWTVEAGRPDSITPEKLAVLKEEGVSRISVNPQTMKAETLKLIGRAHTPEQVKEGFWMAREAGFDSINMDIIIGLPEETEEDVARTLAEIAALGPDDLTVHSLAIKRSSRLRIEWEQYEQYVMENSAAHMALAAQTAATLGMSPYYLYRQKNIAGNMENIGYAKPGKEGLYNILIMEELQSIVALGAGAITKRVFADGQTRRCENVKDVEQYIARVDEMCARKEALFLPGSVSADQVPKR